MAGRVEGKVALITGGGSGIGRACAVRFAKEGANVCVADLDLKGATETAQMVEGAGRKSLALQVDTTDEAAYVPALEAAGYVLRIREPDWYEHRMFREYETNVNLHVLSRGCEEVDKMLLFRDWLREHPDDREIYERTKRELVQRDWEFGQEYADAKTAVVEEIVARAREG